MIYEDFAYVYDSLMEEFAYEDVYKFIENIISKRNVKDVLEMACGTGTLTRLLSNKYNIDAFDLSEDMLTIADLKIGGKKNIRLFRNDMRNFNFGKKYDLILSTCDSLNYILEKHELKNIFDNVYSHLGYGGVFIFDLNTDYKFRNMENVYVDESDNAFYVWENYYDTDRKINKYYVNFFINNKYNDLYSRSFEEHTERSYDKDEIVDMLREVGFVNVKVYDDYSDKLYTEHTERAVYVVWR